MGLNYNLYTPWNTMLFDCVNPAHGEIKNELLTYFYESEKSSAERIASGIAVGIKSNLHESAFDLFDKQNSAVQKLKHFCGQAISDVVHQVNAEYWKSGEQALIEYRESWFHITRDGGYHDVHNHPNCSWCAIYYVDIGDASEDNGGNAFYDPRTGAGNYNDIATTYLQGSGRTNTDPVDGKLVIFPSYLMHSAPPYHGKKDRVVVALNTSFREKTKSS